MVRGMIFSLVSIFAVEAACADTIDCNISEKQKHAIHTILCRGGPYENRGCFSTYYRSQYRKYTHENNNLRACGYAKIADEREKAILIYGKIIEPLGQCIGENANLQEIYAERKAESQMDMPASCTQEQRAVVENQLPEIQSFIAAMNNPGPIVDRLYQNLGVVKP